MTQKPPSEDDAIWRAYRQAITPLSPKHRLVKPPIAPARPVRGAVPPAHSARDDAPPTPPLPLQPVPRGENLAIQAPKTVAVSATLDLHGLTQKQAYVALSHFLERRYQEGYHRWVLVITGKGPVGQAGVLWQCLPDWLNQLPLRAYVSAFAVDRRGRGAYTVRLRRHPALCGSVACTARKNAAF